MADVNGSGSPAIVTLSSLFPSAAEPTAGVFIRERMFRVARCLPLCVVAPRPWFPGQGVVRHFRKSYRPPALAYERMDDIDIYRPRFVSLPAIGRFADARAMAYACLPLLRRLREQGRLGLLDAHFAWPDGVAAACLGQWLGVPVTITLRGTEVPVSRHAWRSVQMQRALAGVDCVFSVAQALLDHVHALGVRPRQELVVGNGVDTACFFPESRVEARLRLGLPEAARVLVTVGGLCERKGFHRVLEILPGLLAQHPDIHYLIVGGASAEGDWGPQLREQVTHLGLTERVHFLGRIPPGELRWPLSASDVFVLPTRNEGWANVLLEALACGLPVVTTAVGGNAEVITHAALGCIVPFGDTAALARAVDSALVEPWDRSAIIAYARAQSWESRVATLLSSFKTLARPTQ